MDKFERMAIEVERSLIEKIAEQEDVMATLRAEKPTVTDAHSDGKRVRYVKAETTVQVLRDVLTEMAAERV